MFRVGARANSDAKDAALVKVAKTRLVQESTRALEDKRKNVKQYQATIASCLDKYKSGDYAEVKFHPHITYL